MFILIFKNVCRIIPISLTVFRACTSSVRKPRENVLEQFPNLFVQTGFHLHLCHGLLPLQGFVTQTKSSLVG